VGGSQCWQWRDEAGRPRRTRGPRGRAPHSGGRNHMGLLMPWRRRCTQRRLSRVLGAMCNSFSSTARSKRTTLVCVQPRLQPIPFASCPAHRSGRSAICSPLRVMYMRQQDPLPDAERLTPIGRFVRQLDESPQLWNVLHGDVATPPSRQPKPHSRDLQPPSATRAIATSRSPRRSRPRPA
jgi:hypothetical protein